MALDKPKVPNQKDGHVLLHLEGGTSSNSGPNSGGTPTNGTMDFYFPIRPEDFQLSKPARNNVVQTLGSAYQEHWGAGVARLSIRGNTGWRQHSIQTPSGNSATSGDGFQAFKALRKIHDEYNRRCGEADDPNTVKLELTVAVPAGFGMYRISSDEFKTSRNTQRPLLFQYEMQCTVLKDMTDTSQTNPAGSTTAAQLQATADRTLFAGFPQKQFDTTLSLMPPQYLGYITSPGETLQTVAQGIYGDITLATALQKVNGMSSTASVMPAGTLIEIPVEV